MIRTQIYLNEKEKKALTQISRQTGQTQSELIREAINLFCVSMKKKSDDWKKNIMAAKGAWKDRWKNKAEADKWLADLRKEGNRKFKW